MPEMLIKILEQFSDMNPEMMSNIENLIKSIKRIDPTLNDEDVTEFVLQMGVSDGQIGPEVYHNFKQMRQTPSSVNKMLAKAETGGGVREFFKRFNDSK